MFNNRPSRFRIAAVAVVLLVCVALVRTPTARWWMSTQPAPAPASEDLVPTPERGTAAGIISLLDQVRVVAKRPQVPGYDRECGLGDGCVFGTDWNDATNAPDGHNGCDTRNDVLAKSLADVRFSERSPDCDVVGGILTDPYT